jgi:DNA processing protein
MDQLIRDLDLPPGVVSPVLLELELDGTVQRQAGGLLARIDPT